MKKKFKKKLKKRLIKQKADSLRRYTKLTNFSSPYQEQKTRIKSSKLEMKKVRLQQTMQKYKGL